MQSTNSRYFFLTFLNQWSWQYIHEFRQICLQFASISLFIFIFMYLATICWILWIYLLCHMVKLIYEISFYVWVNDFWLINRPEDISQHPELYYKLIYLFIEISLILGYTIHWYRDWAIEERGGRPIDKLRYLPQWKYIADYFPIRMELSRLVRHRKRVLDQQNQDFLDKSKTSSEEKFEIVEIFNCRKNYLVGYHPHGIFGLGALINFGTEANQFSKRFPGIKPWMTTLAINFKAPFQRDIMLSTYTVSATYHGIMHLLDPKQCGSTGNFVVVVLGGADEALDSRPRNYIFHMGKRYGFFRIALLTGSDLVPCVSFGEPNMYKQVWNPKGSWLRNFQEKFTRQMTFSIPLFYARSFMPYRNPVTTVIGDPLFVEKNENPTREEVAALKDRYCKALKDLFDEFKPVYDPNGKDVVFV